MAQLVYESATNGTDSRAVLFQFSEDLSSKDLAELYRILMADVSSYAFDYYIIQSSAFDDDHFFATYLDRVIILPPDDDKSRHVALPWREVRSPLGDIEEDAVAVEFALDVRGPILVTTDDITPTARTPPGFTIVRGQPLFYLRENEAVNIIAIATLGSARDNTKYSVVERAIPNPDTHSIVLETTNAMTPYVAMKIALDIFAARNGEFS